MSLSFLALGLSSCGLGNDGDGGGGGGGGSAPLHISIQDARTKQGLDLEFELQLDRAPEQEVKLLYATSLVNAEPADFVAATSAEVTVGAGEERAVIRIPTFFARRTDEPKEIAIDLQASPNVVIERGHALGTIDPRIQTIRRFAELAVGALDFGGQYACAITAEKRGVECWGGGGDYVLRPTRIVGLETGVASIAVSGTSACAVTLSGALQCWTADAPTPTVVPGMGSGVTNVSLGPEHRCAVLRGAVKCWGSNTFWQLGDGTQTNSSVPIAVKNMTAGIKAVSVNGSMSCALSEAGAVSCWGNTLWQPYVYPNTGIATNVGLASGVTEISLGEDYSCALKGDGSVVCWGRNVQRADYNVNHHLVPMTALGSDNVAISARYGVNASWVCGKKSNGSVQCTEGNEPAQTVFPAGTRAFAEEGGARCAIAADGATTCNPGSPIQGTSLTTPAVPFDIATNVANVSGPCVVTTGGGVACLGDRGALVPVKDAPSGVRVVAATDTRACLLTTTGELKCWVGSRGRLGNGTPKPVDISSLGSDIAQIVVGARHACVRTQSGAVRCWGTNDKGQLGLGMNVSSSASPRAVPGLEAGIASLSAGGNRSCALAADGTVTCWGENVGPVPVRISPLPPARAVSVGPSEACVIANDGGVACWKEIPAKPRAISLGAPATAISVGDGHVCAAAQDKLKCWGSNGFGQLGNPSTTFAKDPITVDGVTGSMDVSAGAGMTCVVTAPDGRFRCFGALTRPGPYSSPTDIIEFL